jgi:hypothetical protein
VSYARLACLLNLFGAEIAGGCFLGHTMLS